MPALRMFRGGTFQGGRASSNFVTREVTEEAVAVASTDDLQVALAMDPPPWLRSILLAELVLREGNGGHDA